jgi:hypothetical protein
VEAGGFHEFQVGWGYIVRPCLKKKKEGRKKGRRKGGGREEGDEGGKEGRRGGRTSLSSQKPLRLFHPITIPSLSLSLSHSLSFSLLSDLPIILTFIKSISL